MIMVEPKINLLDINIKRAVDYALGLQKEQGFWHAPLDSNSTMEAEFLLLMYFLGVNHPHQHKIIAHILKKQGLDGSWSLYYKAPGDLSTTVECYFALMLCGVAKEQPHMQAAKQFILANGGLASVRVFTKIWLALFGQWSWKKIPVIPPEIMHLPSWFPINIYEFASWARATIIPLTIVMAEQPVVSIPKHCFLSDLLLEKKISKKTNHFNGWSIFFNFIEKVLRLYEYCPWKPGRKSAIKKAEQWIISHQEADGSWAGIQPPWVYSLIALKLLGYSLEHPIMIKGIQGFDSFSIEDEETLQIQACVSPVWDTSLMINALNEAGVSSRHPQLLSAGRWLLKKQILVSGDWKVKAPKLVPGGWAFEFENNHYPDVDDTAEVLMALSNIQFPETEQTQRNLAIQKGLQWLIGMQSANGGWAAFDKDNDNYFLAKFPFFDFGEILDPPSVDVTAHVLEALGTLGYKKDNPIISKAVQYLYKEQELNGSWFGRWGVNYVYGIASVISALKAVGESLDNTRIQKAIHWLLARQNNDGGWGESCASYLSISWHGKGHSTASQTAWALLALMAVNLYEHVAVKKGIAYLCKTINETGTWDEPDFTGCGFPGYGDGKCIRITGSEGKEQFSEPSAGFMINYHLYRHCWPLMALGRFRVHGEKNGCSTKAAVACS